MSAALDRSADRIADAIRAAAAASTAPPAVSSGTVVAVTPGGAGAPRVTVSWRGAEVVVPHAAAYAPAVGDAVALLRPDGCQLLIADRIVGGPARA